MKHNELSLRDKLTEQARILPKRKRNLVKAQCKKQAHKKRDKREKKLTKEKHGETFP